MKGVFALFISIMFFNSCNNGEEVRIFLIPKNYEGPLLMIEDPNSIDTLLVKGDTVIFDFTKSFILRLRGNFIESTHSISKLKYFSVDKEGNKTEIPLAMGHLTKTDSNKSYIYLKYTQIGERSKCDLISSPKNFDDNFYKQEKLCDSLLSKYP